jgi:hypothetical protein
MRRNAALHIRVCLHWLAVVASMACPTLSVAQNSESSRSTSILAQARSAALLDDEAAGLFALRIKLESPRWTMSALASVSARRGRRPTTRGLNRNHNRVVKDVFKSAATAAATRSGALQDWYNGLLARGMREELARVTLARKLAALTLRLWKTRGRYDPTQLTVQAQ